MGYGVTVEAFVDSDYAKVGLSVEETPILAPSDVSDLDTVVVGTMYQKSVFDTYLSKSDSTIIPYDDFQNHISRWNIDFVKDNFTRLQGFYRLLEDEASRSVLKSAIRFAITRDLTKIAYSDFAQYAHPKVKARRDSVILDGGAYNGDSVSRFMSDAPDLKSIFCFEPMRKNIIALYDYVSSEGLESKVFVEEGALGDSDVDVFLSEDAYSPQNNQVSKIGDMDKGKVRCWTIDQFCSSHNVAPTLIKLDLEGFEINALLGARDTLKRLQPDLQIGIYHNPEEFLEIPMLLKELDPEYRFYLGHHGEGAFWDTVLYCSKG